MRWLALTIAALMATPVGAAIFEVDCDKRARNWGLCTEAQHGERITVFAVGLVGHLPRDPNLKANSPAGRLRDALSMDWQQGVTCTVQMAIEERCDPRLLERRIANPMSRTEYADEFLRRLLWILVRDREWSVAREAVPEPPGLPLDGIE